MRNIGHIEERERIDRLRLIRSEHVGPVTFRALMARYGTAAAALNALPELARRGARALRDGSGAGRGGLGPKICTVAEAQAELAALAAMGARLVAIGEPEYPPLLAHISDAPPLLGILGSPSLLRRPTVAMVGARNASLNGRRLAAALARDLGAAGVCVVSGLARGVDAAAHDAALASGTAAVVAGGLDVIYPPEHRDLHRAIADRGLIIAESPPGQRPQARHFPRRNRLISGVCRATVVVEASLRSGALITARMALEQGREVLAVPGSPLDPRARGCNDLIRQGAALVETAADILSAIAEPAPRVSFSAPTDQEHPPVDEDAEPAGPDEAEAGAGAGGEAQIAAALSAAPVSIDEIIRSCQLSPPQVHTTLLEWELAGRIERLPGNRIVMIAFAKS